MKYKPVSVSSFTGKRKNEAACSDLVKKFASENIPVALVEDWQGNYKNFETTYACLYNYCYSHKKLGCRASVKQGKLYLVNTALFEKEVAKQK